MNMHSTSSPAQTSLQESEAKLRRFLSVDPDNAELLISLANIKHRQGDFNEAEQLFVKALMLQPGNSFAHNGLGQLYLSGHRFSEAEAHFLKAIEASGSNAAVNHNLGLAYLYQEKWGEAARSFQNAYENGLTLPSNSYYLAYSLHHLGELDQALTAAQRAVEDEPSAKHLGYLSLLHHDLGNHQKAQEAAQHSLEMDPDNVDAQVVLGDLALENMQLEDASNSFERAIQLSPDNSRAWLGHGLSRLHDHQYSDALKSLNQAKSLMPDHNGTTVALGWAYLLSKDLANAEAVFRKAIEEDRNFAEGHGGLASALALQKSTTEANEHIKRADRLNPANFGSVYAKSVLKIQAGAKEEGTAMLQAAMDRPIAAGLPSLSEFINKYCVEKEKSNAKKASHSTVTKFSKH